MEVGLLHQMDKQQQQQPKPSAEREKEQKRTSLSIPYHKVGYLYCDLVLVWLGGLWLLSCMFRE